MEPNERCKFVRTDTANKSSITGKENDSLRKSAETITKDPFGCIDVWLNYEEPNRILFGQSIVLW